MCAKNFEVRFYFTKWVLRMRKIAARFDYAQYLQFCAGDFATPHPREIKFFF
jgi:hypothetical protein